MTRNKVVVYKGPGEVAVEDIGYPKLEVPADVASAMGMRTQRAPHGVILRVVLTNICGSDQHMVRGRTTAPVGQTLGHEIMGEVVEAGDDVQFIKEGDICSVPFNIACGRCRNCKERQTGICLNVNPARAGSAYGYVDMGGWIGGQADYVMVPFADFNLLPFPDRDQALEKILDLTMLSDIFPTGYHGCYTAGVTTGSTVYIAGAGPVGLAAAHSAQLLGASVVIVGDMVEERLQQARSFGCETIDLTQGEPGDMIEQILGIPEVDCAVDAVGFEARGHGADADEQPATVLNDVMSITRAGGALGIPGLYVTGDPGAADPDAQEGTLKVRLGLGWAKSHSLHTGQCPVKRYNRSLMMSILHDKAQIANAVNATVLSLDQAPEGYSDFDSGVAKKFVFDPHGYLQIAAAVPEHRYVRPRFEYGIKLQERDELAERYAVLQTRVYNVEVTDGTGFGVLFLDQETHTLVWDGALEFEKLGYVVLEELPARVWERDLPPRQNLLVGVALFLRSGEVVEGILGRDLEEEKHVELLANPEEIAAARYDVVASSDDAPYDALDYALTVETIENRGVEFTIQLPGDRDWTAGLFEWVVEHHYRSKVLRSFIDFETSAKTLSDARQESQGEGVRDEEA